MKKILKCLLMIALLVVPFTACNDDEPEKKVVYNDREYTAEELYGEYTGDSTYRNGTSYDYYLEITEESSIGYSLGETWEGSRLGLEPTKSTQFTGSLKVYEDYITIGSKRGTVKTVNGTIVITINDMDYEKSN